MSKFTIEVADTAVESRLLHFLSDLEKNFPAKLQWQVKQPRKTNGSAKPDTSLSERFEAHFQRWKKETAPLSSTHAMFSHPDYLEIIKLGGAAVPLILKKMQVDPQHLFYALLKITGENPVPAVHIGKFDKMTNDWLDWGRQKGYLQK